MGTGNLRSNRLVMAKVYIGLGTNLGDEYIIPDCVHKIEERIGKIVSLSAYVLPVGGFLSDNAFLNAAVLCGDFTSTVGDASITHAISNRRWFFNLHKSDLNPEYKDGVIDIDLLLYDDLIINIAYHLKLPPSADAGNRRLCDGAVGGDCARCDASKNGKDTGGYVLVI